ncbi:C-type lectin domain family 4 member M-like isoform X1 [Carassius carassius]|uniref:C-type lectin domain family 4 member M-like isoform X1 n=1 Tax=Carassius carassius TaxID=217509 RepID=UPI00286976A0|nr:C-type lectin domain family 4 member M-like isoform X1 [Carassius carassius]
MELVNIYESDNHETCSQYNKIGLNRDGATYANKDRKLSYTEERARNQRGLSIGNKCVVLSTVCFSLICIFLVAAIVVLHIKLMAENEVQTTHMLQSSSRDQKEKDLLQNSFNSLSRKKLELETRVKDLTAEKIQLQSNSSSLSQKKLELETRVKDLTAEKDQLQSNSSSLSQKKLELETRVKDLTAEKTQLQSNSRSLSQKKLELETRVKDLTAEKTQLQSNSSSLSQKKLELETRVNNLTAEKTQLQSDFVSLNEKKLELERRVTSLSEELKKEASKRGWFFMSTEKKSWSESRQYCRDRGADLIIIKSEEKQVSLCKCLLMNENNHTYSMLFLFTQRHISSLVKERVWIGLSDIENEGIMKWVDYSPLNQGFWLKGEPNDQGGTEDCIELMPSNPVLNNWNDLPCSEKKEFICEK